MKGAFGPVATTIAASDGERLAATVHGPQEGARSTVVVAGATAVARGYYSGIASFLASRGHRVITFDYRGIGGSRPRRLRGFPATMRDWGEQDIDGALAAAAAGTGEGGVHVLAHSAGGWLSALAPRRATIRSLYAVGSQSGYYGHWPRDKRLRNRVFFGALLPAMTRAFGYFPARLIGFADEDLPKGVALQWARWCLQPAYVCDDDGTPVRAPFAAFAAPVRAVSLRDDDYAPAEAVDAMLAWFRQAPTEHVRIDPSDVGVSGIGHFGFFRSRFRDTLWPDVDSWIRRHASPSMRVGPPIL